MNYLMTKKNNNGTQLTAVCNTKNVKLVKSLGADIVIDYQTQDSQRQKINFISFLTQWAKVYLENVSHC